MRQMQLVNEPPLHSDATDIGEFWTPVEWWTNRRMFVHIQARDARQSPTSLETLVSVGRPSAPRRKVGGAPEGDREISG